MFLCKVCFHNLTKKLPENIFAQVCFCNFLIAHWGVSCLGVRSSLSLSLSLSISIALALALARFVPVTEGSWARVPFTFFLPMAPIASAFSKRNRPVGRLEFPWLLLCVMFDFFLDFCVLDTCRRIYVFGAPQTAEVSRTFALQAPQIAGKDFCVWGAQTYCFQKGCDLGT